MKVLHLINNLGSGGAEKLLEDSIPLMNESENVEADILLLTDENNVFFDSLISKGVVVDVIKFRNLYDVRNVFEIRNYIVSGGYDIVHSHIFPTQYWVALSSLILLKKKVKFITTEHNTHNRRRKKFYFRPVDKFIYAQYDSIISISEKTRDNLRDWIDPKRKNPDKHFVIENGVDIKKIKEALPYKKNELIEGISENTKLVCMIGRFSEQKDQPTLIKALSKLSEDVHLVLVGDGPLMSDNKKIAAALSVSERVHFLGFRQDIPRILKTVDIVVLSSNWEGFGLVAVEGMAAMKPLIASDVDGLKEVVTGAGVLFKTENELKEAIQSLIIEDSLYKIVSQKCLSRAQKYDIKDMVVNLLNKYRDLL